jgi:hypothetical protein
MDVYGSDKLPALKGNRPVVRIHLLGPMRATTCFGDGVLPRCNRARAVLAYLCLAAGEDVTRAAWQRCCGIGCPWIRHDPNCAGHCARCHRRSGR